MAVLASVQDRVEVWNKSVKMPEVNEEDSGKWPRILPKMPPRNTVVA